MKKYFVTYERTVAIYTYEDFNNEEDLLDYLDGETPLDSEMTCVQEENDEIIWER